MAEERSGRRGDPRGAGRKQGAGGGQGRGGTGQGRGQGRGAGGSQRRGTESGGGQGRGGRARSGGEESGGRGQGREPRGSSSERGRGERDQARNAGDGTRSGRSASRRGDQRPGRASGRDARAGAPPRRTSVRPPKPRLPEDTPRLPRGIYADVRATSPPRELEDVARAVSHAGQLLADGDPAAAVTVLTWAKAVAPRSVVVRETLGIAAYQAGSFDVAHRELLAYRRLSDRQDQNHLLADCARALGRRDKVDEYVAAMASADVPVDRRAEGAIVQAGSRADSGDLDGALRVLERAGLDDAALRPYQARLWYAAADLYERRGDLARAREYFEAILTVDEDFLDVEERLAALDGVA